LIRLLFTSEEPVNYSGRYYNLEDAPLSPSCYRDPHVPILVGGTGEKRTLRTLAKYGDILNIDGWSGRGMSLDLYHHKVGVLETHCENVGRDPSDIKHSLLMPIKITNNQKEAEEFIKRLGYRASDPSHGNFAGKLLSPEDSGSVAGSRDYVIERIAEFVEAGVDEIMFGGISTGDTEQLEQIEQDIVGAFR
jgi:alkanesulfonate monooxygenase SsuD/methylene tetrahydromethanopterin reductase-like flavin-dependent oxidoreductase (luciferase family)